MAFAWPSTMISKFVVVVFFVVFTSTTIHFHHQALPSSPQDDPAASDHRDSPTQRTPDTIRVYNGRAEVEISVEQMRNYQDKEADDESMQRKNENDKDETIKMKEREIMQKGDTFRRAGAETEKDAESNTNNQIAKTNREDEDGNKTLDQGDQEDVIRDFNDENEEDTENRQNMDAKIEKPDANMRFTTPNSATQLTNSNPNIDLSQISMDITPQVQSWLDEIMTRWNLRNTTKNDINELIPRIWSKQNAYDPDRDFVVFYHPMKTGGTSVSDVLSTMKGVLPGSAASSHFQFKVLNYHVDLQKRMLGSRWDQDEWYHQHKVVYSHHSYRGYFQQGTNETKGLYGMIKRRLHRKRPRHIIMLREPLAFVASNYHEWFCSLSRRQSNAEKKKIPKLAKEAHYYGCDGYTLHELSLGQQLRNKAKCGNKTAAEIKKMKRDNKKTCEPLLKTKQWEDQPECANITTFLASTRYQNFFHNHQTFAQCTFPASESTTSETYLLGALEFLSGLDISDYQTRGTDMMWVGITERMEESMCLLHYQLQLPWMETPTHRVHKCRPSSYWNEAEIDRFYKMEPMMIAVHKAANIVLDIMIAKLRYELRQIQQVVFRNDRAAMLQAMPHVKESCFDVGVKS